MPKVVLGEGEPDRCLICALYSTLVLTGALGQEIKGMRIKKVEIKLSHAHNIQLCTFF